MPSLLPVVGVMGPLLKRLGPQADEYLEAAVSISEDRRGHAPATIAAVLDSYRKLADTFREVLSEQSLDQLLHRIGDTLGQLVPFDDLTFYEADEGARELVAVHAIGTDAEKVIADGPFPYGTGITGWAVEHREPVLANRAERDPRVRFVTDTTPDPESLIVVPLVARGALKGTLNVYRVGYAEFTQEEFELVVRFADAAALAIDNAHIRASLEHQAQTDHLTGLWNHRAFHEHVRRELTRASVTHSSTALVMVDLDDFKRVNDVYGHALGDTMLVAVADALRGAVRDGDEVCRIGGEEFGVIAADSDVETGLLLARRITELIGTLRVDPVDGVTVSIGVAAGPQHAANPRELIACAETAMMAAKASGKSQIVVFGDGVSARPTDGGRPADLRSLAHLKLLHDVSGRLARLNDVSAIARTIADELRQLVDYHNCRVFVRDGSLLRAVAFRGDLTGDDAPLERLSLPVGRGITGHVAQTGRPFMTGDAARCALGHQIAGTEEIEESLLAVPLRYGQDVVGVIVVSKLGLDQFDAADQRLLEVVAGHAAVAFVNARLLDEKRREAEGATALLELSRELATVRDTDEVLAGVARGAARILGSRKASVWLPASDGSLTCRGLHVDAGLDTDAHVGARLPAGVGERFAALTEPFAVPVEELREVVPTRLLDPEAGAYAVAPILLEVGWASLTVAMRSPDAIGPRELALLEGIAAQTRLALATADRFAALERRFVAMVEALGEAVHSPLGTDEALALLAHSSGAPLDPAVAEAFRALLEARADA